MNISLKNRHIGTVQLDAVTGETHLATLKVTTNPMESGAMIADHAILAPKSITIKGVIVDHALSTQTDTLGLDTGTLIRGGIDFLNDTLPDIISTLTEQTADRLPGLISNLTKQAATRVDKLLGDSTVSDVLSGNVRALAPWLPDFVSLLTSDKSNSGQRVGLIYRLLLALQKAGEAFEIQTGAYLYRNMLLESLTMEQTMDGQAEVTIVGKEIFIVSTRILSEEDAPMLGDSVSGRAKNQLAKVSQRGCVNTVP